MIMIMCIQYFIGPCVSTLDRTLACILPPHWTEPSCVSSPHTGQNPRVYPPPTLDRTLVCILPPHWTEPSCVSFPHTGQDTCILPHTGYAGQCVSYTPHWTEPSCVSSPHTGQNPRVYPSPTLDRTRVSSPILDMQDTCVSYPTLDRTPQWTVLSLKPEPNTGQNPCVYLHTVMHMWQSQVENEHYSTLSVLI